MEKPFVTGCTNASTQEVDRFVRGMATKSLLLAASFISIAMSGCLSTGTDSETGAPATTTTSVYDQLFALYTDQPMEGGQETPSHLFLDQGDGRILFLHFNDPNPANASGLLFVGDAFLAQGCVGAGGVSQEQIDAGYVHFHKQSAANWDQGHHTTEDPATMGFWFRHIAAAEGVDPMGTGAVAIGEAYPLMPSHENAPVCPTTNDEVLPQ